MSHSKIVLTSHDAEHHTKEMVFEDHARVLIGRAKDCEVCLPADEMHCDVSRHHCMIEIAPPNIRLADLGSRNGTFVNGAMVDHSSPTALADMEELTTLELKDGDEVRLGSTRFYVRVEKPNHEETAVVLDFWTPVEEVLEGHGSSTRY
jgi:eukaryotic-like serine/threonine-protein kinase